MPQKKKKKQINGFYLFMLEIRPTLEREGRAFPNGMSDVVAAAHPRWKLLPEEERKRYDNLAKEEKKRNSTTQEGKYTCDGRLITDVQRMANREKAEVKNMHTSIRSWIQSISKMEAVAEEKFYFISFNIVCQVLLDGYDDQVEHIPNEVSMVEYSIGEGITKSYHKFINPGQLPIGYAFAAKQHSEETHSIPTHGFELADDNIVGIWIQMRNFINPDQRKSVYPPVFSSHDQVQQTKGCLDWLHSHSMSGNVKNCFNVYDINILFMELRAKAEQPLAAYSEACNLLSKNSFDYTRDICCDWHEQQDVYHCSLGTVKRKAFLLSDAVCHFYNVEVTTNHMPEQVDSQFPVNVPQASSSYNSFRQDQQQLGTSYNNPKSAGNQRSTFYEQSASQASSVFTDDNLVGDLGSTLSQTTIDDFMCDSSSQLDYDDVDDEDSWTGAGIGRGSSRPRSEVQKPVLGRGRGLYLWK